MTGRCKCRPALCAAQLSLRGASCASDPRLVFVLVRAVCVGLRVGLAASGAVVLFGEVVEADGVE